MKKINILLLILGLLINYSCSDKFFDVNTDPNNPSTVTPDLVLPSAMAGQAFVLGGYYHALGSFWSQQYAQAPSASQWSEWESYNLQEDDFDRQFRLIYAGALYDYEYVRKSTAADANWTYYAIATLMQAYTFQVMADLYDKVPFTEALKGSENFYPKYDDGEVVYDSLLNRIDKVITLDFNASSALDPGTSDLIFGGDMDKWIQFANTLKLKIYLRYTKTDPTKYASKITALLSENNFLTSDAAFSAFKDEETGYNPYYNTFVDRLTGNINGNNTLLDFLKNNSDDRYKAMFTASATGSSYLGVTTGTSDVISGTIKNYATPTFASTKPVYFFTVEEVKFLIAEAEYRYGSSTNAQTAFNAGVTASFSRLGVTPITYTFNGLQSIIEQKWVAATNMRAIEAFFDYNRTGYPDFFTISSTSVLTGNLRPKRLFYPSSERQNNPNTPAKVAISEPVWWAK